MDPDFYDASIRNSVSYLQRCQSAVKLMEKWLPTPSSVLDLGCGARYLRDLLPPSLTYIAADLASDDDDVILCDLNKGEFPEVRVDMTFLLGVAEYLTDLPSVLEKIRSHSKSLIFTYDHSMSVRGRQSSFSDSELDGFVERWAFFKKHNYWRILSR